MTTVRIGDHELGLLAGRGVVRWSDRTLYVADLHIGKASAFARGGVPISGSVLEATTADALKRLTAMIVQAETERLVVLGDLLHAAGGRDPRTLDLLERWRWEHRGVDVVLVRGNHDQAAGDPPSSAGIRCVDEPFDDRGLTLRHHPLAAGTGTATLAGHVHPAVRLRSPGDSARVACFWLSKGQLVLPAFGGFTGMGEVRAGAGDRVFVPAEGVVVEVPVVVSTVARVGRSAR
ncbi:MAG: ligase-associated DNA damage response endonuclease PdeM [Phycisphaerales bacterium]|nr:ligase-associated DNA damage response endonuclease PdeM [Phycisphaerales bacterium]